MAHFCHVHDASALSDVHVSLPGTVQIGLWGGGPHGEDLHVVAQAAAPIVKVRFLINSATPHVRIFEVTGVSGGQAKLEAKVPNTGVSYSAPLRINVGGIADDDAIVLANFYHGTSLQRAKELLSMNLVPFAVPEALLLDVNEFTDFGKGFYTHPEESKKLAVEWAKRRNGVEWGVIRCGLKPDELEEAIRQRASLHFPDKFRTRPINAPILSGSINVPANWIEFVEFNRHVRTPRMHRPKDNDWTADFGWIRGPIWGRGDSGLPGAPGLPERFHQINWGLAGLQALNKDLAKRRRFLFMKDNEHLL